MENDRTTAARPKFNGTVSTGSVPARKDDSARKTAARKAYRTKIESLLSASGDERLAAAWQRVCPLPVRSACEMPDRRGLIADLADFAEVLQPSLNGLKADRLCRLIEKYAAWESGPSDLPGSQAARQPGTQNYWAPSENFWKPAATLHG